ncbi:MAG: hypothetical protein JXA13_06960 [Anaerolineales bacterium]|nr:hypothetical protein [Anaerolineales bacterium]
MLKNFLILSVALTLMLSACGPQGTPTPDPAAAQNTAIAIAWTWAAETQLAAPTTTPPPTETPIPLPTEAPTLIQTPTVLSTGLETPTFAVVPTNTTSGGASGNPCNQPITTWEVPSAKLIMTNGVKKTNVVLSLYVVTDYGECGYMSFNFSNSTSAEVPTGNYSAFAWVDGKTDFRADTTFRLTPGSWNLMVEQGRLVLRAGCAPDC